MRNFTDAQNALQTALNSTNSAIEENNRYMESIQAKANRLSAEFQKLILGDGGLEKFAKTMLDVATASVQLIESLGGLSSIMTILISTGIIVAINNFEKLVSTSQNVINVFSNMGKYIKDTINKWIELQINEALYIKTTDAATISTNMLKLSLSSLVAVLTLAVIAFNAYQQYQEKAQKLAHDTVNTTLEQADAINKQLKNLQDENKSREDLVKAIQAVDSSYKDEGQSIDEINKKRQEAIDKLKEEGEQALKNAKEAGQAQFKQDVKTLNSGTSKRNQYRLTAISAGIDWDDSDGLNVYIENLKRLREAENAAGVDTTQLNKEIAEQEQIYKDASNNVDSYKQILYALDLTYDDTTGKIRALTDEELALKQAEEEESDAKEKTLGILEQLGVSLDEIMDKLSDEDMDKLQELLIAEDVEGIISLLKDYGIELSNVNEQQDTWADRLESTIKPLNEIESNYSLLAKAMKEFNEKGGITANTLKQLNELDSKWLSMLQLQNGQLVINKDGVQALAEAEQQEAIASLQAQASQDMLNVALGNFEALSPMAKEAIQGVAEGNTKDAEEATKAANAEFLLGEAIKYRKMAEGSYEGDSEEAGAYIDAIMGRYQEWIDNVSKWTLDFGDTSSKTAGKTKDAWVEAFEEEQRQLKHSLEMNEITEMEYYDRLKELNEKYFGEISGKHQKYIKEYQENEEEIYKGTKAIYDKVKDYLKEAVEQGYEKAINALKKEEKKVLDEIKKQIESLKTEKKQVLDGIKNEINALKKQKEAVQKYYNDQIDAIKKENEVLQEQNQLLEYQQALQQAKAQKVMVYKEGKFQLSENESAVSQAEQNLANYQDQLSYEQQIQQLEELRDAQVESIEARIESLEEYYDYMEDYYDRQIESMEEYYNQVQEQYELQIEALQAELDAFKEGYQKSEDLENARLASSVLAANEEAAVWQTRLDNLASAVTEYNKLLSMLGEEGAVATSTFKFSQAAYNPSASIGAVDNHISTRASGDASFKGDEIALVGESPNAELVLGSRLNNSVNSGKLTHLSKGSGVVNAESTQTLAGLLNGLATPTNVSNARSTQQTFNFGSITLPNVTNAESFVGALRDKFNNYSLQYSTIKR